MSDADSPEDRRPQERVTSRLAQQWSAMRRHERDDVEQVEIVGGSSNFTRAEVPYGVDLAAAWSWRFLVIAGAAVIIGYLISFFAVVVIPLIVALLITALVTPLVELLVRAGVRRGIASILVVIVFIAVVAALLTFAGQQVANGASDLADSTVAGLGEVKNWLQTGPLHASDSQINDVIKRVQDTISSSSQEGGVLTRATEVGTAVGHVFAGFFIVLFSTFFFLSDGRRIWAWLVRLSPRAARERVDSSGHVAWISLTQFVRATVLVAATDAVLIGLGAAFLSVPFSLAIGVLVFLGAFVPIVGAVIGGGAAVLIALVANGPITALIVLGIIVAVMQLEGHVLQPLLLGRAVALHPLAVVLSIASGLVVAGIAGALFAVPLLAVLNSSVRSLLSPADEHVDPDDVHTSSPEQTGPDEPGLAREPDLADELKIDR